MTDWTDFKKTFTQSQEDAIWQYFIDHANLQPNGYFQILFHVRNIDDFWKRLYARFTGDFKRYDVLKAEHKQSMLGLHLDAEIRAKMSRQFTQIEKSGSAVDRLAVWLYRICRKHIERYGSGVERGNTLKSVKTWLKA